MQRNVVRFTVGVLLAVSIYIGFYACKKDAGMEITVENNLGIALTELYVSDHTTWETPLIHDQPLLDGQSLEVSLNLLEHVTVIDLYAKDQEETTYRFKEVPVGDDVTIELHLTDDIAQAIISPDMAGKDKAMIIGEVTRKEETGEPSPSPASSPAKDALDTKTPSEALSGNDSYVDEAWSDLGNTDDEGE